MDRPRLIFSKSDAPSGHERFLGFLAKRKEAGHKNFLVFDLNNGWLYLLAPDVVAILKDCPARAGGASVGKPLDEGFLRAVKKVGDVIVADEVREE